MDARWLRLVALVLALSFASSCGDDGPASQVLVIVDVPPALRAEDGVTVNVEIRGRAAGETTWTVADSFTDDGVDSGDWPFVVSLAPLDGDATRQWEVIAEASKDGVSVRAGATARSGYVEGQARRFDLCLAPCTATCDASVTEATLALPPFDGVPETLDCPGATIDPVCGDDVLQSGEQCDDGNTLSCDGCSADCREELCGNGVPECDEGCDDGNTVDDDACSNACAIRPFPPPCNPNGGGEAFTFVVSFVDYGRSQGDAAPGFNLDGYITEDGDGTGCGHPDRSFDVNGDGTLQLLEQGIDNQIASLAPTLESALIPQQQVTTGRLILLIRVFDVGSLVEDGCVGITIAHGGIPMASTLQLDSEGRIAAGQTFDVIAPLLDTSGRIVNGRVIAEAPFLTLPITLEGTSTELVLHGGGLGFRLNPDALTNGLLGGGLVIEEIVPTIAGSTSLDPGQLQTLLESVADLQPSPEGVCQAVSTTFVFEAVPAAF